MSQPDRFGTLDDVPLTDAWAHEAHEFTPWLAQNLSRLSDALGIPLELTDTEVAVEAFAADILARNPQDDTAVLIENQFKPSDHGHLGQIMTYLAGLNASTVVWIAPSFREPHLSAIRWLNENTPESFAFFAVALRVVRIADSPMVPLFDVVERPNAWERRVQETKREAQAPSAIGAFRRNFWAHMLRRHPSEGDPAKPYAASSRWRELPDHKLAVVQYIAQSGPGIFIRCPRGGDDEAAAELLDPYERQLEERLGVPINATNPRYLFIKHLRLDATNPGNWDHIADWLHEEADRYVAALTDVLGEPA
ncbi:MAG: hypothetical protein EBS23_00690 [Betaproteobacteria bacterium]|nr:hypothetical protein [Betaproteobacteria bacterium]